MNSQLESIILYYGFQQLDLMMYSGMILCRGIMFRGYWDSYICGLFLLTLEKISPSFLKIFFWFLFLSPPLWDSNYIYSWPLTNTVLNCTNPLILGFKKFFTVTPLFLPICGFTLPIQPTTDGKHYFCISNCILWIPNCRLKMLFWTCPW